VLCRPSELDDLRRLAQAWGVSASAVGWALLSDRLAELRSAPSALGDIGVDIVAASRRMLARAGAADPPDQP